MLVAPHTVAAAVRYKGSQKTVHLQQTLLLVVKFTSNYTSAANKPVSVFGVTENNATSSTIAIRSGLWGNTAVITEINFYPAGNNFVSGSSFYLYGIKSS